ncbi:hypothetical protein DER44DRAFT_375795 [Fusarium oxysporum]|nr:hypothetical protein DER44DRAFT_375795 [Fusarium oxysporum]
MHPSVFYACLLSYKLAPFGTVQTLASFRRCYQSVLSRPRYSRSLSFFFFFFFFFFPFFSEIGHFVRPPWDDKLIACFVSGKSQLLLVWLLRLKNNNFGGLVRSLLAHVW